MMRGSSTSGDGDRGGRWVAAQIALMVLAVAAAALPVRWPASVLLAAVGVAVGFLGVLLAVWAWRTLGSSATPFPRPRRDGTLVVSGPYAFVRHPVYAGGLLFFVGLALATSPLVLLPVLALGVLWRGKAAAEERLLAERYDGYSDYRRRVPGAFVPRSLRVDPVA